MELSLADWQEEIIFCACRFVLCAGGRKTGKSWMAAGKLVVACGGSKAIKSMVATPVSSQADEIVDALNAVDGVDELIEDIYTRPTRIFWKGGSRTEFRSLEKAGNIRSRGVHLLIIDEIQNVAQDKYESVLRPCVAATQGQVLMLGQMRPGSWYHKQYFLPGQAQPGSELNPIDFGTARYKSYHIPSSMGPAFQTEAGKLELQIARSQMASWRFQLEYEGILQSDAPDICFPYNQIERITRGDCIAAPGEHTHLKFIIGCDIGKTRDPSAVVALNVETGVVEYTEIFPLGMEHAAQAKRVGAIQREWGNALVILDATGGGAPARGKGDAYLALYRAACPRHQQLFQVWQNKNAIIEALALIIERQEITIPPCMTNLLDELRNYHCELKNGIWKYYGNPDNLVSALAMAAFARQQKWVSTGATTSTGMPWT